MFAIIFTCSQSSDSDIHISLKTRTTSNDVITICVTDVMNNVTDVMNSVTVIISNKVTIIIRGVTQVCIKTYFD